jgi:hypothetical protein
MFNINLERLICNLNCGRLTREIHLADLAETMSLTTFASVILGHVLVHLNTNRGYIYRYTSGDYEYITSASGDSQDELSRQPYISLPLYHRGQFVGTLGAAWNGKALAKVQPLLDLLSRAIYESLPNSQIY